MQAEVVLQLQTKLNSKQAEEAQTNTLTAKLSISKLLQFKAFNLF